MGGGCPSVRWSGGTYADEALSVSAATLLSATSSWLMAHLRLFRPHRGTQSLRFPDHNFPVMRTCAALATQTPRSFQLEMSSRRISVLGPQTKPPIKRMSDFRASWLGSEPAENHPSQSFKNDTYPF